MPTFPEKDSLLLSKLYQTAPWMAKLHGAAGAEETNEEGEEEQTGTAVSRPTAGGDATDPIYGMINST